MATANNSDLTELVQKNILVFNNISEAGILAKQPIFVYPKSL
jgi:hypothetical protein